ncbi:MAG: hypothetical protein WDZ49_01065, partial [Litorilinea sp.]
STATVIYVCPVCQPDPCATCHNHYCAAHAHACLRCGMTYCADCLDKEPTCPTCSTIKQEGRAVHIEDEPCSMDARVRNLPGAYNWLRADNANYSIYRGQATLLPEVTVAVDRKTRQVLAVRKISLMDSLRSRFGR